MTLEDILHDLQLQKMQLVRDRDRSQCPRLSGMIAGLDIAIGKIEYLRESKKRKGKTKTVSLMPIQKG